MFSMTHLVLTAVCVFRVICLCAQFEAVLQHGLRKSRGLALTAAAIKQVAGFTSKTEGGRQSTDTTLIFYRCLPHFLVNISRRLYGKVTCLFIFPSNLVSINLPSKPGRPYLRGVLVTESIYRALGSP